VERNECLGASDVDRSEDDQPIKVHAKAGNDVVTINANANVDILDGSNDADWLHQSFSHQSAREAVRATPAEHSGPTGVFVCLNRCDNFIAMTDEAKSSSFPRALAWVYHALAIVALVTVVFLLNDMRVSFRRTGDTVNQHLPEILAKTRTSTETLAQLSDDIRELRDLAGATGPRDRSLVRYADEVLDCVETSNAVIGVEAVIGKGLTNERSALDWATEARKEALYLTFAAASREELLERLTRDKLRRDWLIKPPGADKPVKLSDWLCGTSTTHLTTPAAP
jgi:hypothetical protein